MEPPFLKVSVSNEIGYKHEVGLGFNQHLGRDVEECMCAPCGQGGGEECMCAGRVGVCVYGKTRQYAQCSPYTLLYQVKMHIICKY